MSMSMFGLTDKFGQQAQYEYRCTVTRNLATTAHVLLEVRLKPRGEVVGAVEHAAIGYGNSSLVGGVLQRLVLKRSDTSWPVGEWTDWFLVFDGDIQLATNENVVYMFVDIGIVPLSFSGGDGPLDGGFPVEGNTRPDGVVITSLMPSSIDVANQNSTNVTVSWKPVHDASGYRVYVGNNSNMTGVRLVSPNEVGTSLTFNPKQNLFGSAWQNVNVEDGYRVYVAVESCNSRGMPTLEPTWAGPVTYTEKSGRAPTFAYVVGMNGERNEVRCIGESDVELHYGGALSGSYQIVRYSLRRQDGYEVSWDADLARRVSSERVIKLDFPRWQKAGQSVWFELRAYDKVGKPVYLPNGRWLEFTVLFYGGLLGVFGKSSFVGDDAAYAELDEAESWRSGQCYVYDGESWRRASNVYTYSNGWRSL